MSGQTHPSDPQPVRDAAVQTIVVLGLGFVGTAVAANLARIPGSDGPRFMVIGIDQDTPAGRAKCAAANRGLPPVYADDPALREAFQLARRTGNLRATTDLEPLRAADVVVCCINLDLQRTPGQTEDLHMDTAGYARLMHTVGTRIGPDTLVTVESTLPLGMCDTVLYPALCEGIRDQGRDPERDPPLLAFCYERVMPGPDYLDSVNHFWRAYGGVNPASARRARAFLETIVNTVQYPLWEHKSTRAAEMAKLLENAYRATNIAFIEEWARLAETAGVDLFDVVASIRVRKGTHDNMMFPGLGVGGYCLTKDALLAAYGAERLLKIPAELPFSRRAILTNERMPLRALNWAMAHAGGTLRGRRVALLGLTYRPQVADTRHSASETLARHLLAEGATVAAWDPLLNAWPEVPEALWQPDPHTALRNADVVVICLPDPGYRAFLPEALAAHPATGALVIDPWNLLGDALIAALTARGVRVRVYGRGDLPTGAPT